MRRFLNKKYILAYIISLIAIYYLIFKSARGTTIDKMALILCLISFFIVMTFHVMSIYFKKEQGSYRNINMERPMFNPRGKADNLRSVFPLHPKFIAVFLDSDNDNPNLSDIMDIQAVRYESGLLTDSIFLPVQRKNEKIRKNYLPPEDAIKYLRSYVKDFPVIIYAKDYSIQYINRYTDASFLYNSIDILPIAKMIYPNLESFETEALIDYLKFETEIEDKLYGARVVCAVYLDYLRLNNYKTDIRFMPGDRKYLLKSVYPDKTGVINKDRITQEHMNSENYQKAVDGQEHLKAQFFGLDEHGNHLSSSGVKNYNIKKSTIFTGLEQKHREVSLEDEEDDIKVFNKIIPERNFPHNKTNQNHMIKSQEVLNKPKANPSNKIPAVNNTQGKKDLNKKDN